MSKILGLDLGTNSIGWALTDDGKETELLLQGNTLFAQGVHSEKGIESSKAAKRTDYRSARKLKARRRIRKQNTLAVLIKNKLCPLSIEELNSWKKNKANYPKNEEFLNWLQTDEVTNYNPYMLRDAASRKKIKPLDLGRALYHLAQRRGFLSNKLEGSGDNEIYELLRENILEFLAQDPNETDFLQFLLTVEDEQSDSEDKGIKKLLRLIKAILKDKADGQKKLTTFLNKKENLGPVKQQIMDLTEKIEANNCETLGQLFYKWYKNDRHNKDFKIRTWHTGREEHYITEFEKICLAQEIAGINTSKSNPKERYTGLANKLYNAIFYQRPLKSQKGNVGYCTFEKNKRRCASSHPLFEFYRAFQFINSIKIEENETWRPLNKCERNAIWPKFLRVTNGFKFEELIKQLNKVNGKELFYNYKNYEKVSNCTTLAKMKNAFEGSSNKIVEAINNSIKNIYDNDLTLNFSNKEYKLLNESWHVLFDDNFSDFEHLFNWAQTKLGLNSKHAQKFAKINLKKDYAQLSLKAIKKILPYLKNGHIYSYAVFMANIPNAIKNKTLSNADKSAIAEGIDGVVNDHGVHSKKVKVVNNLIAHFRENYANSSADYKLDERDKTDVREFTENVWGKNRFNALTKSNQTEIVNWIAENYEKQLRKKHTGLFMPNLRLDERIIAFLKDNFDEDNVNSDQLYHPSAIKMFPKPNRHKDGNLYLASPQSNSVKNPMAMKTLHQLRYLLNYLIREELIDEDTKINIELARELNDANKRKAIKRIQRETTEKHDEIRERIAEFHKKKGVEAVVSQNDILKYKLREEQKGICVYTGDPINCTDFLGKNPKYDIEHTLPLSKSFDDSQSNKTLAQLKFNRQTKGNKLPVDLAEHEQILQHVSHWKDKIDHYELLFSIRKKAKGIETKEQKDKRLQEKHYYKYWLDYWRKKYNTFIIDEVPEGFKNSQLVDTGIITKFARAYLKSVFNKVYSVKGDMVSIFRKVWGLQNYHETKERNSHFHHTTDAIIIACMTKNRYDYLASEIRKQEENKVDFAINRLEMPKPWKTFTQDVKALESKTLSVHGKKYNEFKQTKRKKRKRGKIVKQNGQPIYQTGQGTRLSLHKETFYGKILYCGEERVVIRKELSKLNKTDVKNIVDEKVKAIIEKAALEKIIVFKKEGATINETVWQNKTKGIALKKIRLFAPSVKNPIKLKQHRNVSTKEYKQSFLVQNDENYGLAVYEGVNAKGKLIRASEIVNALNATIANKESELTEKLIFEPKKFNKKNNELTLKYILKKKLHVLLYNEQPKELTKMAKADLFKRLFIITQLDTEASCIKLLHHQEARLGKDISKHMGLKSGMKGGKNLDNHEQYPWIKVSVNSFDALVEGYDFELTPLGEIKWLKSYA